jgi:hypothetical protein
MKHTALLRQNGEYSPLFPLEFYEAPQYGTYTPSALEQVAPATPTASTPKRRYSKGASPKLPTKTKRRGRPPIIQANSLKAYLQGYNSPGHALAKLPKLAHIVTGAVSLDYGDNAKPLGMKTALVLLRSLDVISTETVLEYMDLSLRPCCERHAQRLAQCIRIIERATRATKNEWPAPGQVDEADSYATVHRIVPCSDKGCAICRPSAEVEQAWSLAAAEQDDPTSTSATRDFEATSDDDWADLEDDLSASD